MSKRTKPIVEAMPPPIPDGGEETASEFLFKHGRMPFITDERKPWTYKGWLLLLVQMLDFRPGMPNRWPYYLQIMDTGRLPDEKIPQVHFDSGGAGSRGFKHAEKCLQIIEMDGRSSSSIRDFLWWLGFALGVSKAPSTLTEKAQEALYRTFNAEIWMLEPADYFGDLICEYKGKGWRNGTGFYPTPHPLCELMARMTYGEPLLRHRTMKFQEPCIGTGRMALHASNYTLRIYGQDVDDLVIMACKVNGALYAPWLSFPFSESFFPEDAALLDDLLIEAPPDEPVILPTSSIINPSIPQGMLFDLGVHHVENASPRRPARPVVPNKATPQRKQKERSEGVESLLAFEGD
ncbi:MAG: hypothetical protein ABI977_17200 [Acidobacteriota bacterium]